MFREARWTSSRGTFEGKAALVRRNASCTQPQRKARPVILIVNLVFQGLADDEIPSDSEELHRADDTEERIADRLEARRDALFIMAVTSDGTRDLFFALPSTVPDAEIEHLIEECKPSVDYGFSLHDDPEWAPYAHMGEIETTSARPWWRFW